jgi:hypothetical protein
VSAGRREHRTRGGADRRPARAWWGVWMNFWNGFSSLVLYFFNRGNYNILNIIWILIPSWIRMKIWPLISVFFIVTLVCAPVLAISASELISSHRAGSSSFINIPTRIPSGTPTATPTPQATITPLPTQDISSIFDLFKNKGNFVIPTIVPRITISPHKITERTLTCPPEKPVGELSPSKSTCLCFEGFECGCYDPQTGLPYLMGTDKLGRTFIVKEGCSAKWANE